MTFDKKRILEFIDPNLIKEQEEEKLITIDPEPIIYAIQYLSGFTKGAQLSDKESANPYVQRGEGCPDVDWLTATAHVAGGLFLWNVFVSQDFKAGFQSGKGFLGRNVRAFLAKMLEASKDVISKNTDLSPQAFLSRIKPDELNKLGREITGKGWKPETLRRFGIGTGTFLWFTTAVGAVVLASTDTPEPGTFKEGVVEAAKYLSIWELSKKYIFIDLARSGGEKREAEGVAPGYCEIIEIATKVAAMGFLQKVAVRKIGGAAGAFDQNYNAFVKSIRQQVLKEVSENVAPNLQKRYTKLLERMRSKIKADQRFTDIDQGFIDGYFDILINRAKPQSFDLAAAVKELENTFGESISKNRELYRNFMQATNSQVKSGRNKLYRELVRDFDSRKLRVSKSLESNLKIARLSNFLTSKLPGANKRQLADKINSQLTQSAVNVEREWAEQTLKGNKDFFKFLVSGKTEYGTQAVAAFDQASKRMKKILKGNDIAKEMNKMIAAAGRKSGGGMKKYSRNLELVLAKIVQNKSSLRNFYKKFYDEFKRDAIKPDIAVSATGKELDTAGLSQQIMSLVSKRLGLGAKNANIDINKLNAEQVKIVASARDEIFQFFKDDKLLQQKLKFPPELSGKRAALAFAAANGLTMALFNDHILSVSKAIISPTELNDENNYQQTIQKIAIEKSGDGDIAKAVKRISNDMKGVDIITRALMPSLKREAGDEAFQEKVREILENLIFFKDPQSAVDYTKSSKYGAARSGRLLKRIGGYIKRDRSVEDIVKLYTDFVWNRLQDFIDVNKDKLGSEAEALIKFIPKSSQIDEKRNILIKTLLLDVFMAKSNLTGKIRDFKEKQKELKRLSNRELIGQIIKDILVVKDEDVTQVTNYIKNFNSIPKESEPEKETKPEAEIEKRTNLDNLDLQKEPQPGELEEQRYKLMSKKNLENLVLEMLNEKSYGKGYTPYPYHSEIGVEGEESQDFIQDWKDFELTVVRDESRNTAIEVAKILVKDLELFGDVLDLVGKNQSVATEILQALKKSEDNS